MSCVGFIFAVVFFLNSVSIFPYRKCDLNLNFAQMSRNLYRIRAKFLPPSPKTAADVVLHYQDQKTMQNFGISMVRINKNGTWR